MRPLIIDQNTEAAFRGLVSWAETHPLRLSDLLAMKEAHARGEKVGVGNEPNRVLDLSFGWRVIFSIEEHGEGNWHRHASVSVSTPEGKALPNTHSTDQILKMLGFQRSARDADYVYLEGPPMFHQSAVNILEKIDDPPWD